MIRVIAQVNAQWASEQTGLRITLKGVIRSDPARSSVCRVGLTGLIRVRSDPIRSIRVMIQFLVEVIGRYLVSDSGQPNPAFLDLDHVAAGESS